MSNKLDQKFYGDIYKAKDGSLVDPSEYIIFLAHDGAFIKAIDDYPYWCEQLGCDQNQINLANKLLENIEKWRNENPDKCHRPGVAVGEKKCDDIQIDTENKEEMIQELTSTIESMTEQIDTLKSGLEDAQNRKIMKIEVVTKLCHEANRILCQSIGDNSQPKWENAPSWQKESAINGVVFHLNNPTVTPQNSHENWLAVKENEGWVYGEEKDELKKTHPCMLPYNQLPEQQKLKDDMFTLIVSSLNNSQLF